VPESCPVAELKLVQLGWPDIEKVSVLPPGSLLVGVKLYADPTTTVVEGCPEIWSLTILTGV
jgi:hypothetical protein